MNGDNAVSEEQNIDKLIETLRSLEDEEVEKINQDFRKEVVAAVSFTNI